jgi:hypothetical protein
MQRLRNTSGHVTSTTLNVNHTAEEAATTEMAAGERLLFTGCYTDSTPFLFGTAGEGILAFSVSAPCQRQATPLHTICQLYTHV